MPAHPGTQPASTSCCGGGRRAIAARAYEISGIRRRRVALSTLRRWLRHYRQGSFQALHPKRLTDAIQSRRVPAEVAGLLAAIKEREPCPTVEAVIRQAQDSGRIPDRARLAPSPVSRLLEQAGLMRRPAEQPD